MEDPLKTVKSALNVRLIIQTLVVFLIIAVLAGMFGLWQWFIDPWSQLKIKFPSLAKFGVGSQQSGGG